MFSHESLVPRNPSHVLRGNQNITVIHDPNINRIIALSDIHSDIHALIICLRDCAGVIKKKDGIPIDINKLDEDTQSFLEMNLLTHNEEYVNDLNYKWIGGNTNIVICGDILDGKRVFPGNLKNERTGIGRCNNNQCTDLEYDQVEIKILRFINSINKLANIDGGRIYKILGNHDLVNICGDNPDFIQKYVPEHTLALAEYYDGCNRQNYFNYNKPGYNLIFEDNAYMFLVINNNIFVHGQLDHSKNLDYYINLNDELNNNAGKTKQYWKDLADDKKNTTAWGRDYSRRGENIYDHYNKCREVYNNLALINENLKLLGVNYDTKDLRVIKGHCPQIMHQGLNSTFMNKEIRDGESIILNGNVTTQGEKGVDLDIVFGIGMECSKHDLDSNLVINTVDDYERYIYKVDIGSTRAFDYPYEHASLKKIFEDPNSKWFIEDLFPRLPQVLEIRDNKISIIRSTFLNTRIHQPREKLERKLNDIDSIYKLDTYKQDPTYVKYLKYKNKYNNLKNKLTK